ncbi:beta-1,3-galactosyltransferase 5-like [Oppia nitens]|uniref:beta-1,3-galactosyltransferase 5-like n=1 Tax=Oppia nitens TaxID=1686743 RepID=UPI0023DA8CE3|nr:beta-1,3-galactosyltransferase 5-like [Oppia nitens]
MTAQLTQVVTIQPIKQCDGRHNITIFIQSGATTSHQYYAIRQHLRQGWVGSAKQLGIDVWFVLGLSPEKRDNQLIGRESRENNNDIIQFGFVDHYRNLSLKTIAMMYWHNRYCPDSRLLVKLDDDVFVNIDRLVQQLPDIIGTADGGISGQLILGAMVQRYTSDRNYIPHTVWPDDYLPVYANGPAYLMDSHSRDTLLQGIVRHRDVPVVDVPEDAILLGIVAQRTGIPYNHIDNIIRDDRCRRARLLESTVIDEYYSDLLELGPKDFIRKQRKSVWFDYPGLVEMWAHNLHVLGSRDHWYRLASRRQTVEARDEVSIRSGQRADSVIPSPHRERPEGGYRMAVENP